MQSDAVQEGQLRLLDYNRISVYITDANVVMDE